MRTRAVLSILAAVLTTLSLVQPVSAKGASRATVTGPGLDSPIEIGSQGGRALTRLANLTGIYPAIFETQPNPMLDRQPVKVLGPRFQIAYVMEAPEFKTHVIVQELYPYAQPNPVTYVKPGQPVYDAKTVGGWYEAEPSLLAFLASKGLPEGGAVAPASEAGAGGADARAEGSTSSRTGSGGLLAVVGGLALLVGAVVSGIVWRRRRRLRAAPA